MNNKAERLKKVSPKLPQAPAEIAHRVPPGQTVTERFPILHEGDVPEYDLASWKLRVFGEVKQEKTFSFDELLALPQTKVHCDIHCVTRWSKLDTDWEGIKFSELLPLLGAKPEARYVMIHADEDYETNIPLADLLREDVILAHRFDGEPLTDKHGWPMRLVVPHLYFWKSAKWITGIEFMKEDRPGFWEQNGFHNYADPFKEERFSSEEFHMPEDEWLKEEFD
ncbi:sulfite oxidase-like oxidoreductase [Paenibacillus agaridevorans]|nr:sulfite oxidase-like oxidoreductase [Paenibacillus agaridevorans]